MTKTYGDIRHGQPACRFGNRTFVEQFFSLSEELYCKANAHRVAHDQLNHVGKTWSEGNSSQIEGETNRFHTKTDVLTPLQGLQLS
eukprot:6481158-Amphidinium_carterae.1